MGSSKLMVTSLSCAELGTAQPQLVVLFDSNNEKGNDMVQTGVF